MGKHTKGKPWVEDCRVCLEAGYPDGQCVAVCNDNDLDEAEQEANAALIAEAFNVAAETGRTPRQLADERGKLLAALKAFVSQPGLFQVEDVIAGRKILAEAEAATP